MALVPRPWSGCGAESVGRRPGQCEAAQCADGPGCGERRQVAAIDLVGECALARLVEAPERKRDRASVRQEQAVERDRKAAGHGSGPRSPSRRCASRGE